MNAIVFIDLQLTKKQIIELCLQDVFTNVGNCPTKLFVTNCTTDDLGNLCAAKVELGNKNSYELYPHHVTCIIGDQDLLAKLILAMSTAVVFQYVTTFSFLVPQSTTIDEYNQELTKRFWQKVQIVEVNYSESDTRDIRKVLICSLVCSIIIDLHLISSDCGLSENQSQGRNLSEAFSDSGFPASSSSCC